MEKINNSKNITSLPDKSINQKELGSEPTSSQVSSVKNMAKTNLLPLSPKQLRALALTNVATISGLVVTLLGNNFQVKDIPEHESEAIPKEILDEDVKICLKQRSHVIADFSSRPEPLILDFGNGVVANILQAQGEDQYMQITAADEKYSSLFMADGTLPGGVGLMRFGEGFHLVSKNEDKTLISDKFEFKMGKVFVTDPYVECGDVATKEFILDFSKDLNIKHRVFVNGLPTKQYVDMKLNAAFIKNLERIERIGISKEKVNILVSKLNYLSNIKTTKYGITVADIDLNLGKGYYDYASHIILRSAFIETLDNEGKIQVKEIKNLRPNIYMQNLYIDAEGTEYYLRDYVSQRRKGVGASPDKPIPLGQINSVPSHSLALFNTEMMLMPAPSKNVATTEKILNQAGYEVIGVAGGGFFDSGAGYGTPIGYNYTNVMGDPQEKEYDLLTKVGTYTDAQGHTKLIDWRGKPEEEIRKKIKDLKDEGVISIHLFSADAYKVNDSRPWNRDNFSVPRSMLVFDKAGTPLGHVLTQNLEYNEAHDIVKWTFGENAYKWVRLDGDLYARRYTAGFEDDDLRSNAGTVTNNVNPILIVTKKYDSSDIRANITTVELNIDPELAKEEKTVNALKDLYTRNPEDVDGLKKMAVRAAQLPLVGKFIAPKIAEMDR